MRTCSVPPTGKENYSHLQAVWESQNLRTFKDFLKWYNNKDVVPTLEAVQKMMKFYHDRGINMLKLGCTLPNLAIICLPSSTNANFYPFTEHDRDLLNEIREDMVGGPSIFTRKAIARETKIRHTENLCNTVVGNDASQLYPFSMCQEMPTGLYTRWEIDAGKKKIIPFQNRRRRFENMVMDHLQNTRPDCKIQSNHTAGNQYKIANFSVDGFCGHYNTVFEAMGSFYHGCNCQMAKNEADAHIVKFWRERRKFDAERKNFIIGKGFEIVEVWECLWWKQVRDDKTLKKHLKMNFQFRKPLSEQQLPQQIDNGSLFEYVPCDLSVPKNFQSYFQHFPPIFKNCFVSKSDISEYMNSYADQQGLLQQPSRMLISSFHLENGSVITPLFNFCRRLGL